VSAPARSTPRGHEDARLAALLALFALAFHARLLAFPALEVSDAAIASVTNARQALDTGGVGGLVLHLVGFGETAVPARVLALLLHAGSTALALLLARRLGLARAAGVVVALLFAVHPLRIEALAWPSQLGTLLGACAFLLGCVLALGDRRRGSATLALALAVGADPRLLLGLVWLLFVERRMLRRAPAEIAVDRLPAAALAVAAWWTLGGLDASHVAARSAFGASGAFDALVHAPLALGARAGTALLPLGLTPHHPHPALAGGALLFALAAAST
jgi:hypothetical protein